MNDHEQARIFDEWINRHQGLLFKIVRAYAFNVHDREDLLQEISIQVWDSIPKFKHASSVTTWLYRIGLYSAIAWSKRERKHRDRARSLDDVAHVMRVVEQPTDPRLEWLYEQVARLDEVDRSLALMWLDNASYRDIATATGISESNVGVKINRIKKHLAQCTTTYYPK